MTAKHSATEGAASMTSIDDLLADFAVDDVTGDLSAVSAIEEDADEVIEEEAIEESAAEPQADPEIDEALLAAEHAKMEIYEAAAAGSTVDDAPAPTPVATPARAARTPRAVGTVAPRVARDLNTLGNDAFTLEQKDVASDELKAQVLKLRPNQVKIAEKFDNIIASIAASKAPSTYVMDCFKVLNAAPGKTMTSNEMVAALRQPGMKSASEGYSEGTARSQVGQVMALFDILKIAKREKSTLTINPESSYAAALEILSTPTT